MHNKETRKLAVVMFTSITGYTAMVQNDESAALVKVGIHKSELEESAEQYNGQVISFYGDGSLSTYLSAIDALNGALQMQKHFREHNVTVRIGLHLGDIVYRDDSVFGDGVNVASRIEAMGVEGSILISEKLQREIVNHPKIQTKLLGSYVLKNVTNPVNIYAISNEGLNIPKGKGPSRKIIKLVKRAVFPITILLLIIYSLYNSDLFTSEVSVEEGELRMERVAVRFQDFAKIPDHLELPGMASHWLGNRLREIPDAVVVNYEDALNQPNILIASAGTQTRQDFAKKTRAINVLEGTIYRQGEKLLFEAHLYNLETGQSEKAFDVVECDINDPMDGISKLGNKILVWWAVQGANVYSVPTTYEAYKSYLTAREVWKDDVGLAEVNLIESITLDSSFIDPYFLLTELYTSINSYALRDSCIELINTRFTTLTPRQRSLLEVYEAEASGDILSTYVKYQVELSQDPYDVFVNTAGMVQAIQYANLPRQTINLYDMIPISTIDLNECKYCETRPRYAAIAYLRLGEIDSAKLAASFVPRNSIKNMETILLPYIVTSDTNSLNNFVSQYAASQFDQPNILDIHIAWNFQLAGNDDLANFYCNSALKEENSEITNAINVESNYLLGNYDRVIYLIENAWPLKSHSQYDYVLIYTSRAYAHSGSPEDIAKVTQEIKRLQTANEYSYGRYKYMLGVMAMIAGDKTNALDLLEQAFNDGFPFSPITYQYDVDLMPLFDDPRFISLVNPLKK